MPPSLRREDVDVLDQRAVLDDDIIRLVHLARNRIFYHQTGQKPGPAPARSTPNAGNAGKKHRLKAATAISSAAVTDPWPPLP